MKKRTKIVLWIVISMTAVFLAVAGVAALAAAMILDDKPFPLSTRTPNGKALKSALKKLDTFSKTKSGKNQDWAKMISNFLLSPVQTVTLDKNEVNALIDTGLVEAHAKAAAERSKVVLANASFDGELFSLKVSKDVSKELSGYTPFGRFVNIYMKFSIVINDNHLNLRVRSLKIGSLAISERWYKDSLNNELRVLENTRDGRKVLKIVRFLKVENDEVTLKYDAKELMLFLMEKLPDLNKFVK